MLTITRLAAIATLAGSAMCQATITNLGGSCWSMPYPYGMGQPIFEPTISVTAQVLSNPFGLQGPHLIVGAMSQTTFTFLMVGYSNPNQLLSGCGCTLTSSMDYVVWMPPFAPLQTHYWAIPPGIAGATLYLQGLFIHNPTSGANFDCCVADLALHVSNGFRVVIQ